MPSRPRHPWLWAGAGPIAFAALLAFTVPARSEFAEWLADYRADHAPPPRPTAAGELPSPFAAGDVRDRNCLLFALFYVRGERGSDLVALGLLRQVIQVGPVPLPPPAEVTPLTVSPPPTAPAPPLSPNINPPELPYGSAPGRPYRLGGP